LAEVDEVIAAARRIDNQSSGLPVKLGAELDAARADAERRAIPRKAFHFAPSVSVAELAALAIEVVRRARIGGG
jgi:hypothetical protein